MLGLVTAGHAQDDNRQAAAAGGVLADPVGAGARPVVEDLGDGNYRIGAITIDKAAGRFIVPGYMLPYEADKPIEFMATLEGGLKSYESVFALRADAFEFNLACILIGLDAANARPPRYHFDPQPVVGDPVSIRVRWSRDGEAVEHDIIEVLRERGEKPAAPSAWAYTGSAFADGRYLAQLDGVLIGLAHDPSSIIEHVQGLALGNWGDLTIDPAMAPGQGDEISVEVRSLR